MAEINITNSQLKLAFQSALIGEIYPEIRAIAFDYNNEELNTRVYLDRIPFDDDYSNISAVVAEVISNFSYLNFKKVKEECILSISPISKLNESIKSLVYARKELENAPYCVNSILPVTPFANLLPCRDQAPQWAKAAPVVR